MIAFKKILMCLCLAIVIVSCGRTVSFDTRVGRAVDILDVHGYEIFHRSGQHFTIFGALHYTDDDSDVVVYIEGDGEAWVSKYVPSINPTPPDPLVIQLATGDRSPNVLYLARPCQYVDIDRRVCDSVYWRGSRYAPEVVRELSNTIDMIPELEGKKLHVVGYSGGGAVAVLLAAQRDDVASIRTIAGNLYHKMLMQYHNVSPLHDSLDAFDFISKVKDIPQVHYYAENDTVVTPEVSLLYMEEFLKQHNSAVSNCIMLVPIKYSDHINGIESGWKEMRPSEWTVQKWYENC